MKEVVIAITAASYSGNKGAAAMLQSSIRQLYEKYGTRLKINLMSVYPEEDKEQIPWDFIRAAEASVADLAVIPMWDLLCCGSEGRMNHPSTLGENWKWRMLPGEFREDIIGRLRWLTDTFQRMLVPPKIEEEQEENEDETDASVSESV